MTITPENRGKIGFIVRGALKFWGFILAIGVPVGALYAATCAISRYSEMLSVLFCSAVMLTAMGGFFGYLNYDRHLENLKWKAREEQRDLEQKAREEKWAAEEEARKQQWAALAERRRAV